MFPPKFRRTSLMLLVVVAVAIAATTVPGLRHRHAGGVGHTHSHGGHTHSHGGHSHGGHSHRHSHAHSHHHGHRHSHGLNHEAHAADDGHDHGRDGWHVHISLFGFEFVLWEPGAKEAEIAETEQDRTKKRKDRSAATGTTVVLLAESPLTAGWVSLFFIDPAPIPAKVGVVDAGANRVVPASAEPLFDFLVAPPPVPPPEIAAFRGVRRL